MTPKIFVLIFHGYEVTHQEELFYTKKTLQLLKVILLKIIDRLQNNSPERLI